jgi:energy-coupling factor transport system ATP-binding protein
MAADRGTLGGPPADGRPRPAAGERLLEARELSAGYGDVPVLGPLDVELSAGDVVALMGRNGSGKTTLLRCLAGVHPAASGRVGTPRAAPAPGVDVALCPQRPESILFRDSVLEEIAATRRGRRSERRSEDLLDAFGVGHLADRHPRDCSAGERLLVATAATAATEAPVLLLDEPTRGLDPDAKARLTGALRAHAAAGGAVVVATHDVELAASLASRVVILAGGRIVADGEADAVLGDSRVFAPQMTRVFGPGWLTPEQVLGAFVPRPAPAASP